MKAKHLICGVVIATLVLMSSYLLFNKKNQSVILNGEEISIPKGSVHWHPKLTIRINGIEMPIPDDIGHGTGRITDAHLSGMRMSPTHTHESDGTIHIENRNPTSKPETLTLGYFFYIWNQTFTPGCIFDYCTDKGTLKLYVNGIENTEFGQYIMRDGDHIVIEYKKTGA